MSTVWRIFAEQNSYLSPKSADKYTLSKMNLTSMNLTIIELGFRIELLNLAFR